MSNEPLTGLNDYQKEQVQNLLVKSVVSEDKIKQIVVRYIIPGGLFAVILAAGAGYFTAKLLPHQVVTDARKVTTDAKDVIVELEKATLSLERSASVNGWPYVIQCFDSRTNVHSKLYQLVAIDYKGVTIYRHLWPDHDNLHDVKFDAETRKVVVSKTDTGHSLRNCGKGSTLDEVTRSGGYFGLIENHLGGDER